MQDDDPKNQDRRPGGAENGFNWKGLILLSVAMGLFGLAIWSKSLSDSSKNLTYAEFKKLVGEGRIHVDAKAQPPMLLSLVQKDGSAKQYLRGYYEVENPGEEPGGKYRAFVAPVILDYVGDELKALLAAKSLEISELTTDSDGIGMVLMSFYLPVFFLLILLYFLFRHQIRAAGKGAMSFGKSKAKLMTMDKNKVTFKDVAGVDEAKEEVWEIVEYLRDPKKFQRLGGRIPKGVLMVGSPGTGKTLLARAIAGEADVPFFSISGSDFVEMFVGVGASRVRDMFEQGKKNAPCLIFIDEIDAVGRHRGHGLGGGHDEREQTLNALLVEMDGFDTQEGVIIIAATNRPDVLDPALLRPGRFDREITVGLPDVNGREEILRVHAKKVKLAEGVELGVIARGTPGYSGAELANVINEAALLAARKGLKAITLAELEEARDKVRWGKERRSLAISEKDKEKTAYHEAGHAILLCLLENTDPLHKVTIIPRGPSLGSTMWLPEQDKYTQRKSELLDQLVVIMGGRVAEEVVFGDVASGASGDIKQATNIARKMVCEWGMSEDLGMVEYGDHQEHVFLGRDMGSPRNYSEATAQKIDAEVKRLIDTAYERATDLIKTHRDKLDAIAKGLLEYETLDAKHIHEIMEHGEIRNPPSSPTPPDLPTEAPKKRPVEKEKESEGGLPGLPAPA
jgi:cell division protease FtsH